MTTLKRFQNISNIIITNTKDNKLFNPDDTSISLLIVIGREENEILKNILDVIHDIPCILVISKQHIPWIKTYSNTKHFNTFIAVFTNIHCSIFAFTFVKGNKAEGGWLSLNNIVPRLRPTHQPPFMVKPNILGTPSYLIWKLPCMYPWLSSGTTSQYISALTNWLHNFYNIGRGILSPNTGFPSIHEIEELSFIYSESLEQKLVKHIKELKNGDNNVSIRYAFHGTSWESAQALLNSPVEPTKQRHAAHGKCAIYLTEISDKAIHYALRHRTTEASVTALILYKLFYITSEVKESHGPTTIPLTSDIRKVHTEAYKLPGVKFPILETNLSPTWELLPKSPNQLAPIALYKLYPMTNTATQ